MGLQPSIANIVVPGVYVRTLDLSGYAQILTTTNLAMIGTATYGPVGTRQRISDKAEATRIFGSRNPDSQLMYAILQYLEDGSNLQVTRITDGTDTAAKTAIYAENTSAFLAGKETGPFNIQASYPAVVTGTEEGDFAVDATNNKLLFVLNSVDTQEVAIPAGLYTAAELAAKLNSLTTGVTVSYKNNKIVMTTDAVGTDASIVFLDVENNAYELLGLKTSIMWDNGNFDSLEGYYVSECDFRLISSSQKSLVRDFLVSYVANKVPNYETWQEDFFKATRTQFTALLDEIVKDNASLSSVRAYLTGQSSFKFLSEVLTENEASVDGFYNGAVNTFSSVQVVELNINTWLKNDMQENPLDWWLTITNAGLNKAQLLANLADSTSYGDFTAKLTQNSAWLKVLDWMMLMNITSIQLMEIANSQEGMNDPKLAVLINWKKWANNVLGENLFEKVEEAAPGMIDQLLTCVDYITVESWQSYLESLPDWRTAQTVLQDCHCNLEMLWSNVNTNLSAIDQKIYLLDNFFGNGDWKPDFVLSKTEFAQTLVQYKTLESWSGFWRADNDLQKMLSALASAPFTLMDFFNARTGELDQIDLAIESLNDYLKSIVKNIEVERDKLTPISGFEEGSAKFVLPEGTKVRFMHGNPQNATLNLVNQNMTGIVGIANKPKITDDVAYPAIAKGSPLLGENLVITDWQAITNGAFALNGTMISGFDFSTVATVEDIFTILELGLATVTMDATLSLSGNALVLTSKEKGENAVITLFEAPVQETDTEGLPITDISAMLGLTKETVRYKKDGYIKQVIVPHKVFGWAKNNDMPTLFGLLDIDQTGRASLVEGVLLDENKDYVFQTDIDFDNATWEQTNVANPAIDYPTALYQVTKETVSITPTDTEKQNWANGVWDALTVKLAQTKREIAGEIVASNLFSTYEANMKNDNALVRSRDFLTGDVTLEKIYAAKGDSFYTGNIGEITAKTSNAQLYQSVSVKDGDNLGISISCFGDVGALYIQIQDAITNDILWKSPMFGTPHQWTRSSFQYQCHGDRDVLIAVCMPLQGSTWLLDDLIVTNLRDQAGKPGTDRLSISVDGKSEQVIILPSGQQVLPKDIVSAINEQLTGAQAVYDTERHIYIQAESKGKNSSLQIDYQNSPAAPVLGFGYDMVTGADREEIGRFEMFYTGSEGNKYQIDLRKGTDRGFKCMVSMNGVILETFDNLSLDMADDRYWANSVTKSGVSANGSSYVKAVAFKSLMNTNPTYGSFKMAGGTDGIYGISAKDYIGQTHPKATGIQLYSNPRVADINLIALPGVSDINVILATVQMCEERQDCFYIVDCPDNLTPEQVTEWANGTGAWDHSALNSNTMAVYYPWGIQYDPDNGVEVHVAPSGAVAGIYARTANVSDVWYPPAGYKRGIIHNWKALVYPDITHSDMVILSGNQNVVNTILDDSTDGIVVMTQKTTQREATALDRVGTMLLLLYTRKLVATAAKLCIHEPNDEILWNDLIGRLNPIFERIKANRGLYEYKLICDENTNTPDLINNNITRCLCSIIPTKYSESLLIDFSIHKLGDTLGVTSSVISY